MTTLHRQIELRLKDNGVRYTRGRQTVIDALDAAENPKQGEGFLVSTDVSFPLEVQERCSLADQLRKLQRLHEEGIISDEESLSGSAYRLSYRPGSTHSTR